MSAQQPNEQDIYQTKNNNNNNLVKRDFSSLFSNNQANVLYPYSTNVPVVQSNSITYKNKIRVKSPDLMVTNGTLEAPKNN